MYICNGSLTFCQLMFSLGQHQPLNYYFIVWWGSSGGRNKMSPWYWELIIYIIKVRHFIKQMFIYLVCLFVCLMVFKAHWTIFQLYHGGHIYWWRKPEDPEKTIDLSQITDTLYRIMLYTSPRSRSELTTTVVIGTDDHDHDGPISKKRYGYKWIWEILQHYTH